MKRKRGRPPKYATNADRLRARRAQARDGKRRRTALKRALRGTRYGLHGIEFKRDIIAERPPPEVLAERDYRLSLIEHEGEPPAPYAAAYYVVAWRTQRAFARLRA